MGGFHGPVTCNWPPNEVAMAPRRKEHRPRHIRSAHGSANDCAGPRTNCRSPLRPQAGLEGELAPEGSTRRSAPEDDRGHRPGDRAQE